jgi:hypothetical protein
MIIYWFSIKIRQRVHFGISLKNYLGSLGC